MDLTPIVLSEFVFSILFLRRLWYMGGTIHDGTKTVMNWTFHATCKSGFKVRCDAPDLAVYDSGV